jgi:hypothetical protein
MPAPRASIFDEEEFDLSGFAPKPGPDAAAPSPEQVRAVAEAAQFRSREPAPPAIPLAAAPVVPSVAPSAAPPVAAEPAPARRPPRRHRTGRNVQFNVKASQETIDAFYAISDAQGWVLGETLEHALAALQRALAGQGGPPPEP